MNSSNSTTGKTEKLKDTKALTLQWDSMDWCKIENDVNRLQSRIAKATIEGKCIKNESGTTTLQQRLSCQTAPKSLYQKEKR